MDDSVIKVLRRNGSWSSTKSNLDEEVKSDKKKSEDFSLDKNFGILAEEIKKRMKFKSKNNSQYEDIANKKNQISHNAKKELLPLLKNIEELIKHRDNYSNKIEQIDIELEKVKNEIVNIKKSYEKNITDLQNNINFFEQSITLIEKIREEG